MRIIRRTGRVASCFFLLTFVLIAANPRLSAQAGFSISASPSSLSIPQNGHGVSIITTAISGGFNSAISLSAAGAPAGTTVSFNPQTIPAPGSGNSTMTVAVGSSTATGTYPMTVTGNGGGVQRNATVTLTVIAAGSWQQGFDFRNSAGFVSDPPGDTDVLPAMFYPTRGSGATYGWVRPALVQGRDRNSGQDPRLAGINLITNGLPATFNVDLPSAGTYNLSLAMGDAGYEECWVQCQIQFLDGGTVLATLTKGTTNQNYFYDAKGNNWSAAAWPGSNLSQQVTLTGTRLTVVVGTSQTSNDYTTVAFLGIAQVPIPPNYMLSASPASLTVQQGNQGASTITSTISGGFNGAISLSASGAPAGTTVSFNPNPIPAPGAGNSTMTITVGASTPTGTYPITVTGNGGGLQQNTTVTLTVTAAPNFTISASPASLSVPQGNQGTSTLTTAISGGFNGAISLSAAGMPSGTTVSFNPNPIPAPGSGNSTMTITVGASTPTGTYPITVTGNGGGLQRNTTVTLTVTAAPNFTISASPASLSVPQGDQGTSTLTTTISGGFNSAISLSAAGMPSGTTVSFNPNPIPAPGSGNSTMTITVGASTPTGTYPITVTGNGGGLQRNTTVTLTVTAAPNFTISASPASLSVPQGNQGTSTLTTAISGGFNGTISLSAAGMPSGTTVSFNPNPIPAPGSGNSTMTITVGASTPAGTYPITVTGNGGGLQRNTTVTLTVTAAWEIGFDFRNTSNFVTDPPGDTYVLPTTAYPTTFNGTTFGWTNLNLVQGRDRSTSVDPRLAGINLITNGLPAKFYVDLPSAGTYNLSLAMGDAGYQECWIQCQIQFLDGSTVLATITEGLTNLGYFYDAKGNNWSAATWPASNLSQQVTLAGTRLTMVVGTNRPTADYTPIAFLGIAQGASSPNYTLSASPAALTIQQGNQGTSTITATISGGFNSAISLSAAGAPAGTTVSFSPNPIPAPGAGTSTMNIMVGANTPLGTYPITVTGNGGGVQQNTTVTLTVTAQQQPNFTLSASPASLTIQQGNQGTSTLTTTISGGFNSAISLSAAGAPAGTTVSFNPNPIPAPGAGNSTMTITVGAGTAAGTYPITVTGNGGGVQQNTTVTLTVTAAPSFTLSASPAALSIAQGNQGTSTITSTLSGGFNSAISLSAAGAPAGTTVSFNPNPIPAPGAGNSTMTITVGASTPTGTYPLTVTGNGGGVQQNTTVTLTVTAAPSFTLSASPAALSIAQGNQGTSTLTTAISGGFNSAISLSAAGVPSGTTVSFNPNPIPAPGAGNSTMTITVGASTPTGTYPITVTGNGGGVQQNTTVTLTVTSGSAWSIGLDFRATSNYVTDPPGDTYVLGTTAYPTTFNGATFGWTNLSLVQSRDRSTSVDPRLAGINMVANGQPATFYVDLPAAGTYNLSLAMGDAGYEACWVECQIQFLDGSTVLATVTGGDIPLGYFYDAKGHSWAATVWPANNLIQQVTLTGTRLTVVVGTTQSSGDVTPIAFLGIAQGTLIPTFALSASPSSLTVVQGNQGTSTVTTAISGGFNSAISLSAAGMPSGTTVSFSPNPIPAPGGGNSTMTITVGASTPVGTYPITVTANGEGVQQTANVTLTVAPYYPPDYILSVSPPEVAVAQGSIGNTIAMTTALNGFNSAINLSASGMPAGTTVSFSPNPIPAPGSGNSTMTITVGANTPLGTYPITVTGNGGGTQHNTTVQLTVVSSVWQQGFDFRASANLVTDPPGDTYVILTTVFPTKGALATYGWSYTSLFSALDRDNLVDPRLAGINNVTNGDVGTFYVNLPAPGTYNLSLAMGDAGYPPCGTVCEIQFFDGSYLLATVTGAPANLGYFYDAQGNVWSAAAWPANNVSRQITLTGTQLTVVVGANQYDGGTTPIAYLGVAQVSTGPTFGLEAPASISVGQGQYSTGNVLTVPIAGFNHSINLSASGAPGGTTVNFNPSTISAPGAGTSIMTISVPGGTALGNYPLTITAQGGGAIQHATVVLTVTAAGSPAFRLTAPSTVTAQPGGQATGAVSTTISNGFNAAVSLSASGVPNGGTVSFNPGTISAPGSGNSTMTINVPAGTPFGSYPITVTATSSQGNQTATVTLTVSASGQVNLPSGTGWVQLSSGVNFCNVSPGYTYYNPEVGAVDAFDFLGGCIDGQLVAYGGGAADTTNDRYFLWTSGHNNYQGNEMYVLNLQGANPTVARVTDPDWTVINADVPPDCACRGTNNCGQGLWHNGAGQLVNNPYAESGYNGVIFESTPAPDGTHNQPSCGYGTRFTPNAREIYAGMVYNPPSNRLFAWGGAGASDPSGAIYSNWALDLNQNPAKWTRLQNSSYPWLTAAVYDYTVNHPTSGSDLVFDESLTLYAYNPVTDTYTTLASNLPYIGYNVNVELDPVHHYLVMQNGDNYSGYHLRLINIDSCNGRTCMVTNLDNTTSCKGALGYWAGMAWDSKRSVMALFPSSTNCSGSGCTPPFDTVYLLNPDPNNAVTVTYQGQQQMIQPQQCFAASYGPVPPTSFGPGVYSRFKYYPNEDIYLYVPNPTSAWILRLEQ